VEIDLIMSLQRAVHDGELGLEEINTDWGGESHTNVICRQLTWKTNPDLDITYHQEQDRSKRHTCLLLRLAVVIFPHSKETKSCLCLLEAFFPVQPQASLKDACEEGAMSIENPPNMELKIIQQTN
jgi:hypothetical protein